MFKSSSVFDKLLGEFSRAVTSIVLPSLTTNAHLQTKQPALVTWSQIGLASYKYATLFGRTTSSKCKPSIASITCNSLPSCLLTYVSFAGPSMPSVQLRRNCTLLTLMSFSWVFKYGIYFIISLFLLICKFCLGSGVLREELWLIVSY